MGGSSCLFLTLGKNDSSKREEPVIAQDLVGFGMFGTFLVHETS